MSAPYHRQPHGRTGGAGRRVGRTVPGRQVVAAFERLSESERLARDLAALVDAGLIVAIDDGDETRFATARERSDHDDRAGEA